MTAFTPQTDPNPSGRNRRLKAAQKKYQFSHTHVSPLALVDHVPMHDEFSAEWILKVADRVMISLSNMAEVEASHEHREFHLFKHKLLKKLCTQAENVTILLICFTRSGCHRSQMMRQLTKSSHGCVSAGQTPS